MAKPHRAIPLRTTQSGSRKIANGRHSKGPRVNGRPMKGKPGIPGAQFVSRDQILPFDRTVFGMFDMPDGGMRIYRVEKYININDSIILVWRRSKAWLTGRYICMTVNEDGSRRVALQTLGFDQTGATHKRYGTQEFEWYDVGPDDIVAVEAGFFYPAEGKRQYKPEKWPTTYEAVEAPDPTEWERKQPFLIPSPPSGPWPKWDTLTVDPRAPIGPRTWVAGFEISEAGFRRPYLGQVRNLQQKFSITDVRTGKEVNMGPNNSVFYGAVVGRTRCVLDSPKREAAAKARAVKTAEVVKNAKRRVPSKVEVKP